MPRSCAFIRPVVRAAATLFVSLPLLAYAAPMECTAKVSGKLTDAQMKKMAQVGLAAAQAVAIESVGKAHLDKIVSKELEVEDGCLLYSFDIRLKSVQGVEEVQIDAISGKVISRKHETPEAEAAEAAADAKPAKAHSK